MKDLNQNKADVLMLEIGDRINQLMYNRRLTATKLAQMAGINRMVLNKIFKGKSVTLHSLTCVMAALDVDPKTISGIETKA